MKRCVDQYKVLPVEPIAILYLPGKEPIRAWQDIGEIVKRPDGEERLVVRLH